MLNAVRDFYEACKFGYYYIMIVGMVSGVFYWEFGKRAWNYIKSFKIVRKEEV